MMEDSLIGSYVRYSKILLHIHVIYIRITENLVILLNDTVVKLFFRMKTLVK